MLERFLCEFRRENALRHSGIDTSKDRAFDRFVRRLAYSFEAPIALVSVARDEHLWIKAIHGLELLSLRRCDTFCEHVLDAEVPLEVCDATVDDRFIALPAVTGALSIRYYLGTRLRLSSGVGIGSLCILDTAARPPASPDQRAFLLAIARQAAAVLETRASMVSKETA